MIVITFIFILLINGISAKECIDGKNNLVNIYDVLGEAAKVRFLNVSIAVYGENKKPLCSKSGPLLVQMPGFLKFFSGEVEIVEPITFKEGEIRLMFTMEHSSFFVGQVCLNGKSENAFVPDSFCEKDFCELMQPETCQLLSQKQTVSVHKLYNGYFELPAVAVSEVGGEWKAEAGLAIRGEEIARIRVGQKSDWIQIQLDSEGHEEL